jgi:hypothetical protein
MEMPTVVSRAIDESKNIRYEVVAYRELSPRELEEAIWTAVSMMKKKPKKNCTYRFVTIIGHDE